MHAISYARHQFPPEVIRRAVWLYLRRVNCQFHRNPRTEIPNNFKALVRLPSERRSTLRM